jgi:hypothetical protein
LLSITDIAAFLVESLAYWVPKGWGEGIMGTYTFWIFTGGNYRFSKILSLVEPLDLFTLALRLKEDFDPCIFYSS